MATLRLVRFNYGAGVPAEVAGTFGKLMLPNGKTVYTCENPWMHNEPFSSCIPEGTYTLKKRESDIVERTSRGKYTHGWEVTNVADRSLIMMHVANWPSELDGCIAVGLSYGVIINSLGVGHSLKAFDVFMKALDGAEEHTLIIDHFEP